MQGWERRRENGSGILYRVEEGNKNAGLGGGAEGLAPYTPKNLAIY